MEFVRWCELPPRWEDVSRSLTQAKDVVVTADGEPVAILAGATDATLEATLSALRQARAQLAVAAMQQRACDRGAHRLTGEDVNGQIRAARRERSG